jgi:hypothetical protein
VFAIGVRMKFRAMHIRSIRNWWSHLADAPICIEDGKRVGRFRPLPRACTVTTAPKRPRATFLAVGQHRAPTGCDWTQVDPRRGVWSSAAMSRSFCSVAALVVGCAAAPPPNEVVPSAAAPLSPEAGTLASPAASRALEAGTTTSAKSPDARSFFACNRRCPGSVSPRFVELAKATAAQAKSCYVRALRDAKDRGVPSPEGKLLVHFRVYEDGSVGCTSIARDELHSDDLTRCAIDVLKRANYAESPPKGPCADVNVPFSFVARESDAGTGSGP